MPGYEVISSMKFLLTKKEKGQDREIVKQNAQQLDNDYRDFGKIYDLFENRDAFKAGLDRLSATLWQNYRTITNQVPKPGAVPPPAPGNLFTRSLGITARQRNFTFQQGLTVETDFNSVPSSVTLIAGDPYIGTLIRSKLFWKDAISADHGEHSHSFQWLVAAHELNGQTTSPIPDLYARTVDYWIMRKGVDSINLWQLLVDCFPTVGGARDPDPRLITDSFRCPQNVTRFLLGKEHGFQAIPGHFISHYLFMRYKARSLYEIINPGAADAKMKLKDIYTDVQSKKDWKQLVSNPARLKRTDVAEVPGKHIGDRNVQELTFHGRPGFVYMKGI